MKNIGFFTVVLLLSGSTTFAQSSIINAIEEENYHLIENLVTPDNVNKIDPKSSGTPLIFASIQGNESIVNLLLEKEAQVNLCGAGPISNFSPLHAACYGGNIEVVKVLIDHGADINKKDGNSLPIHTAAELGFKDIVEYLREKGEFESDILVIPNKKIMGIQELLEELGFYMGKINGVLDEGTRTAMNRYKERYSSSLLPGKRFSFSEVKYFDYINTLVEVYGNEKDCDINYGMITTEKGIFGCVITCPSNKRKFYDNNMIRVF